MSLDNIQLPSIVIQQLFKNSLIDLKNSEADTDEKKDGVPFLGSNKKRVCIVVADETAVYLADEQLGFLLGILSACKLNMEDVAIINFAKKSDLSYILLQQQLQAETLLLFGVTPRQLQLPLDFPYYQIQKFNGQLYLTALALQQLQQDKAEKTKLWNCLKQLFLIS
jgi:hypothetical protein